MKKSIKHLIPTKDMIMNYINMGGCMLQNAIFLAERYHTMKSNNESLFLLSQAYYKSGNIQMAYGLLLREMDIRFRSDASSDQDSSHSDSNPSYIDDNRYLFAQCCYSLKKYREAQSILLQGTNIQNQIHILAAIMAEDNNPLTSQQSSENSNTISSSSQQQLKSSAFAERSHPLIDELVNNCPIPKGAYGLYLLGKIFQAESRNEHAYLFFSLALRVDPFLFDAYECICALGKGGGEQDNASFYFEERIDIASDKFRSEKKQPLLASLTLSPVPVDISTTTKRKREDLDTPSDDFAQRPLISIASKINEEDIILEEQLRMLSIYSSLGKSLFLLSRFKCDECLRVLSAELSYDQFDTAWVYHKIGKAYFECSKYSEAVEAFEHMRKLCPERLEGLELLSTGLWHIKKETDLAFLAQQAVEIGKGTPQAWCVVGNCFSLQKEHDLAIKFFQRAIQIDPTFTYAYTLTGHEFVSNEDFDKALSCFRHAIRIDQRHYNAWYGLGMIYQRQEKYELAETHFRKAIHINSQSSALYCFLAMALRCQDRLYDALNLIAKAASLQPNNPQTKIQRANIFIDLQQYEDAYEELLKYVDYAPKEPSVYVLLGRVCTILGKKSDALVHFTTALDLDPKDTNHAKSLLDKLMGNEGSNSSSLANKTP